VKTLTLSLSPAEGKGSLKKRGAGENSLLSGF
jgi:hypothetical protein